MGWWTNDRKRYALDYLVGVGFSIFGAAGLVSRWANVESSGQGPFSVNPSSGAFGIAQWLGSRLPPIRGNTDFDAQLGYVITELNGSEWRAGELLRNASSAQEGAIGATVYERAEGYNGTTDNFTGRTVSGIPAIIALANSGVNDSTPNVVVDGQWQPGIYQNDFSPDIQLQLPSAPVLIGAVLLALLLIKRLGII